MLLPGALIVFMGFNAGGYFPATPAVAALVLAQSLLVRIMQARHPFEGFAPATLVAIAALGGYALLTLLSALWSHAPSRALIEFDRAWFYLLILLLFGSALSAYATAEALTSGSIPLTAIQIGSFLNGNVIAGQQNVGKALGLGMVVIIAVVMVFYFFLQRRASRWLR